MFAASSALVSRQVVRCVLQKRALAGANIISGPPRVRVSFAEKLITGLVMSGAMLAIPTYVLVNLKVYTAGQQE